MSGPEFSYTILYHSVTFQKDSNFGSPYYLSHPPLIVTEDTWVCSSCDFNEEDYLVFPVNSSSHKEACILCFIPLWKLKSETWNEIDTKFRQKLIELKNLLDKEWKDKKIWRFGDDFHYYYIHRMDYFEGPFSMEEVNQFKYDGKLSMFDVDILDDGRRAVKIYRSEDWKKYMENKRARREKHKLSLKKFAEKYADELEDFVE